MGEEESFPIYEGDDEAGTSRHESNYHAVQEFLWCGESHDYVRSRNAKSRNYYSPRDEAFNKNWTKKQEIREKDVDSLKNPESVAWPMAFARASDDDEEVLDGSEGRTFLRKQDRERLRKKLEDMQFFERLRERLRTTNFVYPQRKKNFSTTFCNEQHYANLNLILMTGFVRVDGDVDGDSTNAAKVMVVGGERSKKKEDTRKSLEEESNAKEKDVAASSNSNVVASSSKDASGDSSKDGKVHGTTTRSSRALINDSHQQASGVSFRATPTRRVEIAARILRGNGEPLIVPLTDQPVLLSQFQTWNRQREQIRCEKFRRLIQAQLNVERGAWTSTHAFLQLNKDANRSFDPILKPLVSGEVEDYVSRPSASSSRPEEHELPCVPIPLHAVSLLDLKTHDVIDCDDDTLIDFSSEACTEFCHQNSERIDDQESSSPILKFIFPLQDAIQVIVKPFEQKDIPCSRQFHNFSVRTAYDSLRERGGGLEATGKKAKQVLDHWRVKCGLNEVGLYSSDGHASSSGETGSSSD